MVTIGRSLRHESFPSGTKGREPPGPVKEKDTIMRKNLARALFTALAGLLVVGLAAPAQAAEPSPKSSGSTKVVIDPAVATLITSAGITPTPTAPATAGAFKGTVAATFPITGYRFSNLTITHSGGLTFKAGSKSITVGNFDIELAKLRVTGTAKGSAIGDASRVPLFTIAPSSRYDLGLVGLKLTDTAAGALNTTFGVKAFKAGDTFGYATPNPFGAPSAVTSRIAALR